jgi:hypothetical protein
VKEGVFVKPYDLSLCITRSYVRIGLRFSVLPIEYIK